ncbi:MAG: TetR/AcrR family transcriptional regulator [Marmoricola sp.]
MADKRQGRPDGRQSRWDEHNAARRAHILDAAIALLETGTPPGDVHVREIAERAGLGRPVVYRHFADRADLDRAVQARVLELMRTEVEAAVGIEGTIDEIIYRIVFAYVGWAAAHPALHRVAVSEQGAGATQLDQTVSEIAESVEALFTMALSLIGVELDEDDSQILDPLVFGLVGQAFGSVRRWLRRDPMVPDAAALARFLTDSIWFQIDGHARSRGLELDRAVPLERFFGGNPA